MKFVFFDDQKLTVRRNATRRYGRAKLVSAYEQPNVSAGLPCVFRDGGIAPYLMFYSATYTQEKAGERVNYPCFMLAVSDDAVHFRPYDTGIAFEGKHAPNQLLPSDEIGEVLTVVRDTEGVYHIFACISTWGGAYDIRIVEYTSADGVHLTRKREGVVNPNGAEALCGSFYNPVRGEYTFLVRPAWADRRCAITHTKDFETYTPLRLAIQPDGEDPPCSELYGMPCGRVGGYYVGFFCLYETADEDWGLANKFRHGHMEPQLTYSFDGVHFQRCLRTSFIPRGYPGDEGYGMVIPYSIIERGDEFVIAAALYRREHGYDHSGATRLNFYTVKRDRLVGLEAGSGWAYVRTRPFLLEAGEPHINLEVPDGEAYARLIDASTQTPIEGFDFDDCAPFTGDTLDWIPRWRGKVSSLEGKCIAIEIKYRNGMLYAIEGTWKLFLTTMQIRRYLNAGILPPEELF